MTNPELILKLVEMLLAERDRNNLLQSHLEEKKWRLKSHYIAESGSKIAVYSCFLYTKKVCVIAVHIQTNKWHNPELKCIV